MQQRRLQQLSDAVVAADSNRLQPTTRRWVKVLPAWEA
jgi:hypothetical protein